MYIYIYIQVLLSPAKYKCGISGIFREINPRFVQISTSSPLLYSSLLCPKLGKTVCCSHVAWEVRKTYRLFFRWAVRASTSYKHCSTYTNSPFPTPSCIVT